MDYDQRFKLLLQLFFRYFMELFFPEQAKLIDWSIEPAFLDKENFTNEQLTDRLFLPMLLEATRALEEGVVGNVRDVDLGMIHGLGFPADKGGLLGGGLLGGGLLGGGLLGWADSIGAAAIVERLEPLAPLGKRAAPTNLLLEMAESGRKFYDG